MALQTLEANVGLRSNSPFGSAESGFLRARGTLNPAICKSIDSLFKWEIKSICSHPTDTPYKSIGWDEIPIEKELHFYAYPLNATFPLNMNLEGSDRYQGSYCFLQRRTQMSIGVSEHSTSKKLSRTPSSY